MFNELANSRPPIIFTTLVGMLFVIAFLIKPPIKIFGTVVVEPITEVVELDAVPDFAAILDVQLKKQSFFDYIRPHIDYENALIRQEREHLQSIMALLSSGKSLSLADEGWLEGISLKYELENANVSSLKHVNALLDRVDIIPSSLALAQAANESAWGTSRFARLGKNFFGQWCYTEGCGIIPARRPAGESYEVRSFDSVGEAVHGYFMNLNTFPSYEDLRDIREDLRKDKQQIDGISLTRGLQGYSERGDEYIWDIQSMIYSNNLLALDEG